MTLLDESLLGLKNAYDSTLGALKTDGGSSNQRYSNETLADEENKADGTYNYYVDMNGYTVCGFGIVISGTVTVKFYAASRDDGTAANAIAAGEWIDVTQKVFGATSFKSSDFLNDNAGKLSTAKYIKVEVVTAGGGTDDYTIFANKLYS